MPNHWDLSPSSPVPWVKELLAQPPGPFPADWFGFHNVAQAFRELMAEARDRVPAPPKWEHERGIVICGGGWRFFPSLFVTVACIRRVGCELPIQVWFLGDRGEFDQRMCQALEPYGVGWICGNSFVREHGIPRRLLGGWELKPLAAAYSPFREVISLDADSYPAYNPERFMEHPEFQRVGAAFWPDQGKLEHGQWERFGLPYHDEAAWESGQFIVDKSRHWKPLWLTAWMNDYSDYVYKHVYGDKDTFHLAWRFCGHDVCVPTQVPGWHVCSFIQMDFDGNCLFCHRTRDKFRWSGGQMDGQDVANVYMTGQWYGETQRVAGLPHEDFGHDMLRYSDELMRPELYFHFIDGPRGWCRDVWDGVMLRNEYGLPREMPADGVVLDIGAHVGAFTRACLRRGARRILAVEPLAVNIAALKHNVGDYGERSAIVVKQAAAWSERRSLPLSESTCHVPGNTSTCTAFFAVDAVPPEEVEAVPLDVLIEEAAALGNGRVALIKIDAEGAEYPALLTAKKLNLVDAVVGETHVNVTWDGVARDHEEVFAALREQGFRVESQANGPCTRIFWARR